MHNPVTATRSHSDRDAGPLSRIATHDPGQARFAPLFTRSIRLAIATVEDELGRPLVGVFVPDGELL